MKEELRFPFGENWIRFLSTVDEAKISSAKGSIQSMLGDIRGKTFLDVGSGSGLFSLAAHRLGGEVRSFDYDPQSVACAMELQRRYGGPWITEKGSILDREYVDSLGQFDVVYSWGVLHHTGDMKQAFNNVASLVKPGGLLFISIYNDQGWKSRLWRAVKKSYNTNRFSRMLLIATIVPAISGMRWLVRAATGRLRMDRGTDLWYDSIDWLGGYPFEVATRDAVIEHFAPMNIRPLKIKSVLNKNGCNEFVLKKTAV